ncbi:nuclear transport factor 2 family protein [Sphingobium sp. H39-3-25]|uniref:nuclear transport factor 2 family protein n=1 Tax=Sphingobium arseniciresistens TaxID=3030834 RepID=UPI0023B96899|nr:nuclear transport factor 2 family protein [Sphingobium arseniciresistens]
MRKIDILMLLVAALAVPATVPAAVAQEAATPAADVEVLFTSSDPRLNANKQIVYHIFKDLLEAGHWELADQYLTEAYIQHNPNVPSGRAGVVTFFKGLGVKPKPIPSKLSAPVVQVVAEGDYVMVLSVLKLAAPSDPAKSYTTGWVDMFRIKDGKADEHWDSAPLMR